MWSPNAGKSVKNVLLWGSERESLNRGGSMIHVRHGPCFEYCALLYIMFFML